MVTIENVLRLLASVRDPEIPALSIIDMGIVRAVEATAEEVGVTITPTYSGCPAMHVIEQEIRETLARAGHKNIRIETKLSPAWSTDWLSAEAREKLRSSGIAPPCPVGDRLVLLRKTAALLNCPFCNSANTSSRSEFGSTPCKALYFCNSCQQPFEYFKPL